MTSMAAGTRDRTWDLREADSELVRLARCESLVKLRMGELLDALFLRSGHFELGFSSFESYVVERCEHSRSWGRATRGFAKRLRERQLQKIREAVLSGQIGWSMADLLSHHATHENEAELLAAAAKTTVRKMQADLTGKPVAVPVDEPKKTKTTRWVSETEIVMLVGTRKLVESVLHRRVSDETFVDALLGEGQTSLQTLREGSGGAAPPEIGPEQIEAAVSKIPAPKARAKTIVEPKPVAPVRLEIPKERPIPPTLRGLDREIRRSARELARRNLQIGRLARMIQTARAWLLFGYGSFAHYAIERVGLSLSSLEHRITLAKRVARYPAVGEALDDGRIGYEAALLVTRALGRTSSDDAVKEWIDRARRRTVKHLREEVDALLLGVAFDPSIERSPPTEKDLETACDFERRVQSGELFRPYSAAASSQPQTSVALMPEPESPSRRPIELTLSVDILAHWRIVEAEFRRFTRRRAHFFPSCA
jgi:hypothetical protein